MKNASFVANFIYFFVKLREIFHLQIGLIWQQFYKCSIGWEKKAYPRTKNDKNVTNRTKGIN